MPVLGKLAGEYARTKPLAGLRVAICLHLEAKTAHMAEVFRIAGRKLPLRAATRFPQDDVAAALAGEGITVYAWYNATAEEYESHLQKTLETEPHLIIDDGGDLTAMLHTRFAYLPRR